MNWKTYKRQLLKNPRFKKEYDILEPEYQIAKSIVAYRLAKGLTQKQLADQIHTKQSSISRIESGDSKPSLGFIKKIADVLGLKLTVQLKEK
ncbi:MAG: helix-turn-helix domain-containing protein [Candidatus Berkelbacteria bacterium Licking1014_7]|uniref:Helix-turn-helix domain-containing protein n=1 Tax=Candidatus Berkelbacteria bacterium Licking1014_7 TaxID=2017147 RepID=A0A554LHK4_9BACT|nr:MAG: helix-turn-helix domain-containing protein [Candidatus Berkelbacteria bacterium Licking1014_7]